MESMGTMMTGRPTMTAVAGRPVGDLPACRLRRVTQYIHDNLHRKLRLAELSAQVHMSPYHFARLFKRSTGTPPHRFVLRRRIDRATTLLTSGELSIGEVARVVGFQTPSHFTTVFRRIAGVTPSVYRIGSMTARPDDRPN
jgi:AraC family transcriptional regulator